MTDQAIGTRVRGYVGAAILALCALGCVAACTSAPALALSQRGHTFAFSFGETGSGDRQFSDPSSVAVNEATADVYVSDTANNRIDQYQPEHDTHGTITGYTFKRAWGWGVADGKKRYETCEIQCRAGIRGAKFFDSPGQIAVDNSDLPTDPARGDVYVVANHLYGEYGEKGLVYEFGPEGEPVSTSEAHGPEGAAAGQPLPAGQPPMALATTEEETKPNHWKRNDEPTKELAEELEVIEGVAVDANGVVWLYGEDGEFRAITPQGVLTEYEPALEASELGLAGAPGRAGIAVATLTLGTKGSVTQDRLYARYEAEGEDTEGKEPKDGYCSEHACPTAEIDAFDIGEDHEEHIAAEEEDQLLAPALGAPTSTGLATDPVNGDAYIDDPTTITALDPAAGEIERFGAAEGGFPGLTEAGGLAVDHAAGSEVGDVYAIERSTSRIDVFAPAPPGPPAIDALATQQVTSSSAQLRAEIDADGAPTTYTLQYSTSACTETPTACAEHFTCTDAPTGCGEVPDPAGDAGEAFGDQDVTVPLTGLAPSSTYHYRFSAANQHGNAVSATEGAFSTPPAAGPFIADQRLWEMVSPPEKNGALIEAITKAGGVIQASSGGGAIAYVSSAPIGEAQGNRSFELTQMLATRGPAGWSSEDLTTPNEHGTGLELGLGDEYRAFSSDLSLALLQPFPALGPMAEPPLSPPLTETERKDGQENTIYLRADQPLTPQAEPDGGLYREARANGAAMDNPGYLPLVTDANVPEGARFGPRVSPGAEKDELSPVLSFRDATPDLAHLIISSKVALTPESETPPNPQSEDIYEWAAGKLSLINLLPHEEGLAGDEPTLGGEDDEEVRGAISSDGSRVFWSTTPGAFEHHLYVRDTAAEPQQTLQLDQVQPGATGEGKPDAVFQAASSDGSKVFFTDTQPLTKDSGASAGRPGLYACELVENQATRQLEECTEQNGRLTDLSPAYETPAHRHETADMQGVLLGASEDGSYVYFVANGVLSGEAEQAGAAPGRCRLLNLEEPASPGAGCNLYSVHYDTQPGHEGWGPPMLVAVLSNEDEPDWASPTHARGLAELGQVTSRVSPDGLHLAFMSQRSLTSFQGHPYDNQTTAEGSDDAPAEEVYEYTAPGPAEEAGGAGSLVCASCEPSGARPNGVLDPFKEAAAGPEGLGLLVDRPRAWAGKWLAGSIPGWTALAESAEGAQPQALHQSNYLSDSGRLFFDTPDALVPQDTNGREDVYEYEPQGVPRGKLECTTASATLAAASGGCVGLISSGTSDRESAFLDASETGGEGEHGEELSEGGGEVFFLTAAPLSPQDIDSEFDVYDAHECTSTSPCIVPPEEKPPADCRSTEECRSYTSPSSASLGTPASAVAGAAGNLTPQHSVLPTKTTAPPKPKPKPLTRAEKFARALNGCRARYRHSHTRRASCERQARKAYSAHETGRRANKSDTRTLHARGRAR
jgi:hypothetical protein